MISETVEMAEALGHDAQLCVIEKKTHEEYGTFEMQTFEFGVRRPYHRKWFMRLHTMSIILSWWNKRSWTRSTTSSWHMASNSSLAEPKIRTA